LKKHGLSYPPGLPLFSHLFFRPFYLLAPVAVEQAMLPVSPYDQDGHLVCNPKIVDGAKLKCVYWITQHKDWGKRKNRPTVKRVGMGHGEMQQAANSGQRAGI
jgi:hypothetical protein